MADNFLSLDGKPISFGGYFFKDDYWQHKVWNLNLLQNEYGLISADVLSGYDGDVVTLSNTPSAGYQFNSYGITGAELSGNQFAFSGSNVSAEANFEEAIYTLTLQTDGHGTIAATQTTGHAGDTVTLSPTYNTYYRFSDYDCTGGTIEGNTFTFGEEDATAKANFKVNAFTATGNFEKGSDVTIKVHYSKPNTATANIPAKYALHVAHTGDIPAAWYNTSNRWKVTTAPSAYKITLNPKMTFTATAKDGNDFVGKATGCALIGSTRANTAVGTMTKAGTKVYNYNQTLTSNSTGVNYGLSAKISAYQNSTSTWAYLRYVAASTTGTWTATGYAP